LRLWTPSKRVACSSFRGSSSRAPQALWIRSPSLKAAAPRIIGRHWNWMLVACRKAPSEIVCYRHRVRRFTGQGQHRRRHGFYVLAPGELRRGNFVQFLICRVPVQVPGNWPDRVMRSRATEQCYRLDLTRNMCDLFNKLQEENLVTSCMTRDSWETVIW